MLVYLYIQNKYCKVFFGAVHDPDLISTLLEADVNEKNIKGRKIYK